MPTPLALSLGSLNLGTAPYVAQAPIQWGNDAVHAALLTGDYRPDEIDEAIQQLNLVRQVSIPMSIRSASADAAITDGQAITALLSTANRFTPLNLTVTPTNSTRVSTFKVWGGSWSADYTNYSSLSNVTDGSLLLQCDPIVYGAPQNLGSAGAPLGTANTPSPAAFTLTPSPAGDIPANVTLFTKNRSANSIRSFAASAISGNTTWVMSSLATGWTLDANGSRPFSMVQSLATDTSTVLFAAHFTTPTLPTDRRFRLLFRADQNFNVQGCNPASVRVRVVTGSSEIIGKWRTPPSVNSTIVPISAYDMGGFMIPVSEVGSGGAGTTTVYVEVRGNDTAQALVRIYEALFMPDDNTVVVETQDTSKIVAAAAATIQLETDQLYDSSGNPLGGVVKGSSLRVLGTSRIYVYTSQNYMGTLNGDYTPENVDVWAILTPRYLGLA